MSRFSVQVSTLVRFQSLLFLCIVEVSWTGGLDHSPMFFFFFTGCLGLLTLISMIRKSCNLVKAIKVQIRTTKMRDT